MSAERKLCKENLRFSFQRAMITTLSVLSLCLLGACGSLRICLEADADTNQGRPLQIVIRSVEEQTYRGDSYSEVSRLVTAPDASVLRRLVLDPRPRLRRSFSIKPPPGRPVGLYVLYTSPSGTWKMLLLPPLPYSVRVPLRRAGIAVEQVRERRFRSPDSSAPAPASAPAPPASRIAPPSAPDIPNLPSIPSVPSIPTTPAPPRIPSAPEPPMPPSPPLPGAR